MKISNKSKKKPSKHSEEVKRILKANQSSYSHDESYIPFIRGFASHLVHEADEVKTPEQFDDETTKKAFEDSLDTGTPKNQYDIEGTNPAVVADAITKIHEWSDKLEQFASFMNSPDSQSLHKLLATEDRPGSLLRGITRKASDSITRIAGEIAKLKETLNGFINMAGKKQRDADITKTNA